MLTYINKLFLLFTVSMNSGMIRKYGLFIFLAAFMTTGCIPERELSFEALNPADDPLPPDASKALVFNMAYTPDLDTSAFNLLRKLTEKERSVMDTLILNNILNGFFYVADESPLLSLRNSVYAEQRPVDTTHFLKPLSTESIRFLLEEFSSDLIISLEYFGMNYDYAKTYDMFDIAEAYLLLDRAVLWRVYSRDGLILEKNIRDTLVWRGSGDSFHDANNGLPEVLDAVKESFWFAGESFAQLISPPWKSYTRSYYSFLDNMTDRSLDTLYLQEVVQDGSRINAYKALFNLSIYHEKQGNPQMAVDYMKKALEIRPGATLAQYYKKKQLEYLDKYSILKEQLGE